ncbi:undecaprenyldiphospho-muramoylpentapeptide beta-N-acetylglucosaminyltransferase [Consotaella aegiceratis]|uniref:undecaprenyldiphospho-muramoylpentapeptide beta-N-acetylglucosaminyltransferase n=1 Tax=Consotaella aegiceratis TaxID=3097961 RepID=UPI002F42DBE0
MPASSSRLILLCAGGTGGHLFPAEALAHELGSRGLTVHLATDERAGRFAGHFPAAEIHVVPSATFGSKNPLAVARSALTLWKGFRTAKALIARLRPDVVVGFGGYPTVPPLLAASRAGLSTMVQEQNAVMGRANRFLARRVDRVAAGFPQEKVEPAVAGKIVVTGNPVRQAAVEAARVPYQPSREGEPFRLLVFGGSQGARFFSDRMPQAVAKLPDCLRSRLRIVQQARPEDEERVKASYGELGVAAEVSPFFSDMPARIAAAHLVVSRSGASTVQELSIIGRPALLVPLPHALDDDQGHNAQVLVDAGGAVMRRQPTIDAGSLANDIAALAGDPDRLAGMAAAAKGAGRPDATQLLADLVASMPGRTTAKP